jgi:ABC-type polysaccharide/polyol phosphate transport system ATPase subunit
MIRLRDVQKVYPTRHGPKLVLDGIGFDLEMGQRLGVLGRNGAGKSTMVRLISGAEKPTSGQIERDMSVSWPLAFGGAFQVMLTGVDNVRFISRIYEQDFERNLAFVEEFAELGPYLREPVRTYSSGMRARLAFAVSMIIEFDCFLIDEVGAVGDARFHERCNYELFEKRSDRAMVIISHDAGYIRNHCNRFAVLDQGKLSLFDDFDESYEFFANRIGLSQSAVATPEVKFTNRATALESRYRVAISDEQFLLHVRKGDWARDQKDFAGAAAAYAAALSLHPYERTFWAHRGSMLAEQGKFVEAEISYRTACAFGQPRGDVLEFIQFVMARQKASPDNYPIRELTQGPIFEQPPGYPDICLFSRLLWGHNQLDDQQVLHFMRTCETLDSLGESILLDDRATHRTAAPIAAPEERGRSDLFHVTDRHYLHGVCDLASVDYDNVNISDGVSLKADDPDLFAKLVAAGGFSDWKRLQHALQTLTASAH